MIFMSRLQATHDSADGDGGKGRNRRDVDAYTIISVGRIGSVGCCLTGRLDLLVGITYT
jgi:hypothetical protein